MKILLLALLAFFSSSIATGAELGLRYNDSSRDSSEISELVYQHHSNEVLPRTSLYGEAAGGQFFTNDGIKAITEASLGLNLKVIDTASGSVNLKASQGIAYLPFAGKMQNEPHYGTHASLTFKNSIGFSFGLEKSFYFNGSKEKPLMDFTGIVVGIDF